MAVLGHNITASPEGMVAHEMREGQSLDYSKFSQDDLNGFIEGVFHLATNYDQKEWLPLFKEMQNEEIENMTPGEALMTYDIMHNPIMEEIAIAHASDAMAFANDVMLNFSRAIDQKQNAFIANLTVAEIEDMGDDADDEDLTPAQKARKRIADMERRMRELGIELHEERMEEQKEAARKEWDAQMHDFGGQKRSGAWITDFYNNWWSNPDNQEKLRKKLKSEGKTDDEIDDTFKKLEERKRLWNLMRDCTNEEERKRLQEQYDALGTPDVVSAEETAAKEKDRELEQNKVRKEKRIEFSANSSDLTESKLEELMVEQPSNVAKTTSLVLTAEGEQNQQITQIDIKDIDLDTTSGQFTIAANNITTLPDLPSPKASQPAPDNASRLAFM